MGPILSLFPLQSLFSGQRPPQHLSGGARYGFRTARLDTGGRLDVSFIANTGEGLNKTTGPGSFLSSTPPPPFERTYSVKMDYTGSEAYASLILSRKADAENIAGFFGGWTASDAVLLYAEGAVTQGSRGLYPVENRSPLGGVHGDAPRARLGPLLRRSCSAPPTPSNRRAS